MRTAQPLAIEVLGDGPNLLLIHGAGGSARTNFPFIDDLATSYTVVVADLPGVGSSPLDPEPLTPALVGGRLLQALDDAGIERVVVCAYSMGTMIASWLAAHAPGRVCGLILTAGLAHADFSCQGTMARWSKFLARDAELAGRYVVEHIYRPRTLSARGSDWVSATALEVGSTFARGTRAHIEMVRSADVRSDLRTSSQPLLLVVPSDDEFVSTRHSEEMRSLRPDAEVIYLESGHAVGDEQPSAWLEAIRAFVDRQSDLPRVGSSEQGQKLTLDAR